MRRRARSRARVTEKVRVKEGATVTEAKREEKEMVRADMWMDERATVAVREAAKVETAYVL